MAKYISSGEFWDNVVRKCSHLNSNRGQVDVSFEEYYGQIAFQYFNTGNNIEYVNIKGKFSDDIILENNNSGDYFFICFNSGSQLQLEDNIKNNILPWDSDTCINGEMHKGLKSRNHYSKNRYHQFHSIFIDKSFFKELVNENEHYQKSKSIFKGEYFDVKLNKHTSTQQKILLKDLEKASFKEGKLQQLYIESKLLDLVYVSINGIEPVQQNMNTYLSSQDIEALNKAREILLENMQNPPSLKELSYKSAINEFKLKKGFKQLFGNTVFGYLQEHRLNEAKDLLESNDINVSEASSMVGYKNNSHFTKIFKDHFGINPIEIRKKQRKIYI